MSQEVVVRMTERGSIYKITNKLNDMAYVGQAKDRKKKNGVPYKYGIKGRWADHISSSATSNTPLAQDIQRYGKDSFEVVQLEEAELQTLDALEANWIEKLNTVIPNGYNVMRHSQNKHRIASNIVSHFKGKAVSAKLSKIRRNGIYKLVYCTLELEDGQKRRIVFGQHKEKSFDDAWNDALLFVEELDIPFEEDTSNSTDPLERYAKKLDDFENENITKIRITRFNSLVAVYITTARMKSWKEQKRICFGGKTISSEEAYSIACLFVDTLPKQQNTLLQDTISQSPQQVAASMDETNP
jgi:group I intron endonuclease